MTYTYGDTDAASRRLRLLAEAYDPVTRELVASFSPTAPALAVDLGCGPGYTTAVIADLLAPERLIAVDASEAFLAEVSERVPLAEPMKYDLADTTLPVEGPTVVFCRFLLGHLPDPEAALAAWVAALAPGGVVMAQEQEWIRCADPVVARYLEISEGMVSAAGASLRIGTRLSAAASRYRGLRCDRATAFAPATATMAGVFRANIPALRARSAAEPRELDALDQDLEVLERSESPITVCVREIVIAAV